MKNDPLGASIAEFRTSRVQPVILLTIAVALAGFVGWMFALDQNVGTPVSIVCVPASLYFLVWGYRLAVSKLEIHQTGVRLRLLRRTDIPFNQIASLGLRRRTVNGLPGSASGIWFQRGDGSSVLFPLESNVEEAVRQITSQLAIAENAR